MSSSTYNLIQSQNSLLSNMITESKNKNTTYNQKSIYQGGDIAMLNTINNYLLFVYYIIVFVLFYYLYYDEKYNRFRKFFIIILFLVYPYLVNLLKDYLVKMVLYIYSIINVNVYENKY
uniref:Uncharacterized protein n=1 Tax=viral metagenome TaxID=1070528 RepID=A0A6C0B6R5_9ZZZZ